MLLQPLEEEVIDGSKVVVAAVLQRLEEAERSGVRVRPAGGRAGWQGSRRGAGEAPRQDCSQGYSWVAENIL